MTAVAERQTDAEIKREKQARIMDGVATWASFYRANPHRFARDYLGLKLPLPLTNTVRTAKTKARLLPGAVGDLRRATRRADITEISEQRPAAGSPTLPIMQ